MVILEIIIQTNWLYQPDLAVDSYTAVILQIMTLTSLLYQLDQAVDSYPAVILQIMTLTSWLYQLDLADYIKPAVNSTSCETFSSTCCTCHQHDCFNKLIVVSMYFLHDCIRNKNTAESHVWQLLDIWLLSHCQDGIFLCYF